MNVYPYIDCQGLGGAWTLGTVQTGGFELQHRASLGAFGDEIVEYNRELLGFGWTQDTGDGSHEWEPRQAAYLNGTPPCSGFSLLNNSGQAAAKRGKDGKNARGIDSAINDCMKELITYAGFCTGADGNRGPEVVAFESVQGAGKLGRPLMQALRDMLQELTGEHYALTHVFMSGSSVGSAQMRHRYYPVFHRIPFGVEHPDPRKVVTYRDAIGDLQHLVLQWEPQLSLEPQSDWIIETGIRTGLVDSHITYDPTNTGSKHLRIYATELLPYFNPGDNSTAAANRYIAEHGKMPDGADQWYNWETNEMKGFNGPRRIDPDQPGYVLTGNGVGDFFHWAEPRHITVREAARLMGYPDNWSFTCTKGVPEASSLIGKCCPVQSGKWISTWVHRALDGSPGSPGEEIGNNEYSFNCTLDYRRWPEEISGYKYQVKKKVAA